MVKRQELKRSRYNWTTKTKTHLKQKRNPMGTEAEPTWLLAQPKRMPALLLLLLLWLLLLLLLYVWVHLVIASLQGSRLQLSHPYQFGHTHTPETFFRKQHGCLNNIEWQNVLKRMWVVRDIWASCTWDEMNDAKDLNNLPMCKSFSRAKLQEAKSKHIKYQSKPQHWPIAVHAQDTCSPWHRFLYCCCTPLQHLAATHPKKNT